MVGLSVILEGRQNLKNSNGSGIPQVINKTSLFVMASVYSTKLSHATSSSKSSTGKSPSLSFLAPAFLEKCFLCKIKLLPGRDIYMYKGDSAFCSEECRCQQILMDEEETLMKGNCSMAASSSAPSPPPSPAPSSHRRASRN
ncbi:hypothetical protein SAY87_023746 [Trapa incisa]|uniref:FLZ-type domain-containing protein n=1 Tax=Trapa incisa TaxID=236973 RepID=A0AAN7KZC4_9MYRT|nr:hypothetical protein SAY87_023746 [Trapa incisa]